MLLDKIDVTAFMVWFTLLDTLKDNLFFESHFDYLTG